MPFPSTQEQMFAAGYSYLKWERCPVCSLDVEVWTTPGKRTIQVEPMPGIQSEVVRHYEVCQPKQEWPNGSRRTDVQDVAGRDSVRSVEVSSDHASGEVREADNDPSVQRGLSVGGHNAQGSGIKLYGVTDKNMIAVGWLAGVLAIQFRYGRYHYANVAEDVFIKIRNNPFPNNMFVKLVKNHPELYPCFKVG